MIASDYLYRYYIKRTPSTTLIPQEEVIHRFKNILHKDVIMLKYDRDIDPDMDEYDAAVRILSKEMGFKYDRQKIQS